MKKYVLIFSLCLVCFPLFSQNVNLQNGIQESVEKISDAYAQRYPDLTVKRGAVILDFNEESPAAKNRKMGVLLRVHLEEALANSMIFYLVDRKNLEAVIEEMHLSLSGLVDDSTSPEFGLLRGSHALVYGTVVEDGADFRISVSITDIEQGDLLLTHSFTVPNSEMVAAAVNLQYEYVAKHGIGLSSTTKFFIIADDAFNKQKLAFTGIDAKYRISRNFMISAGIMIPLTGTGEFYRYDRDFDSSHTGVDWSFFQPDLPSFLDEDVGQITNEMEKGFLFHLTGQYTLNFSPKFNIGFKLGGVLGTGFTTRYIHSAHHGLYTRTALYDETGPDELANPLITRDSRGIELRFGNLFGGKAEISPEFFITPRTAVNATIGYLLTNSAKVRYAYTANGDWNFPDESGYNDKADEKYFGLDPRKKPDGSNWELNLSGLYAGVAFSFFF